MSLSNKRKAGAPSIERSAKVPRTALGMEDSNSQISMAALFRANKLVHDLKESQLRTILVQAYVSHPEIAHVVDLEHAKINETLSEPDAEPDPAPDSASDSEPDHVAGDHAREGSDNDMSASEDEMTKRNRKITELKRRDISESFSCSCKDGCANGRCECSKNSFSCGPDCKCTSCANYLNQLALFFGEQRLRATNCFASWMKAQGPDLDLDSAYTQEELRSTIMGVDEKKYYDKPEGSIFYDGSDEEIQELGKTWLKAKTEAQRKPIRMVLFKKAFLEDGVHFFSFCSGAWEESHSTDHCPICDECNDWRDWHCMDCGKCQFGISIPCEGCGGVSNAYHGQLESL